MSTAPTARVYEDDNKRMQITIDDEGVHFNIYEPLGGDERSLYFSMTFVDAVKVRGLFTDLEHEMMYGKQ